MNFEPAQIVVNSGSGVSTVSLKAAGRDVSHYEDSGDAVISGVVTLVSGEKYNVNGTWKAATTPGVTRAVYLCRANDMQATNNLAETLYDLAGRHGVLYGVEYTGSGVATHTCYVVVAAARPISMMDRVGASIGRKHAIQVEMMFDRLNGWS